MKIIVTLIYITLIGQVCFFAGVILPRRVFNENAFPFRLFKWEKDGKFFEFLYVKKWKSKVPDMSRYTDIIYPKRVQGRVTSQDVDRLIKETCVAEATHYVLSVFGLGIYWIWKNKTGKWLTILYIVGNVPFVVIQRYLRPKYIRVKEKLLIREERQYAKV